MADMREFGAMDESDRGGAPAFAYADGLDIAASPGLTPSQTIGPFFAYGLTPGGYGYPLQDIHSNDLAGPDVPGERITIEGTVFDAAGVPVHDAMIEILQADGEGVHVTTAGNDGFTGFGRCGTCSKGPAESGCTPGFAFHTIRPGAAGPGRAPSIGMILTMRGLMNHCVTVMYFPEDAAHDDLVLAAVPPPRQATLIAEATGPGRYRFDIHMRGEQETVFFDV